MTPLRHALQFLKRRLLTKQELADKLLARSYSPAEVQAVIEQLEAKNILNDKRLAEDRAATLVARKNGRHNATRKLAAAGIRDETVRRAVEAAYDSADEASMIRQLLTKKLAGFEKLDGHTRYRRAFGLLLRKGFDEDAIRSGITEVLGIDADDADPSE